MRATLAFNGLTKHHNKMEEDTRDKHSNELSRKVETEKNDKSLLAT